MNQPFPRCYWVIPGKFLAGEYPRTLEEATSRAQIAALADAGVTAFIDLTHEQDGLLPYAHLLTHASHQRFAITDVSVPDSVAGAIAILDAIDHHLQQGKVVYLHCWGGIGRTGLIVGCWLARHGYAGEAALTKLRELWQQCSKSAYRQSPETWEQEQYVLNWPAGQ